MAYKQGVLEQLMADQGSVPGDPLGAEIQKTGAGNPKAT
jgi:hypothetical protein